MAHAPELPWRAGEPPRVCVDVLAVDELAPTSEGTPSASSADDVGYELGVSRQKRWPPGASLRVAFLDGNPLLHERVLEAAGGWTSAASVAFVPAAGERAHVRVSFRHPGSWSAVGTDARLFSATAPTLNLGWLRAETPQREVRRVVLHEFGHALGFIHEHQSPSAEIPWNVERVLDFFQRTQNWTRADVERNLFARYARETTNSSAFDARSIMLYPIPAELTRGGFQVGWNDDLSAVDRSIAALHYPRAVESLGPLLPGQPSGALEAPAAGALHAFDVDIAERGRYVVSTVGDTDLALLLRGPIGEGVALREVFDDDSGQARNARIVRALDPGRYQVLVSAAPGPDVTVASPPSYTIRLVRGWLHRSGPGALAGPP